MDATRRQAIARLALGGLGAAAPVWAVDLATAAVASAGRPLKSSPRAPWRPAVLTAYQNELVATIAELIIPRTDTPGARDARVSEFIDAVLADAEPATRGKFLNGLSWFDQRCRSQYGVDFAKATPEQQAMLLAPAARPVETPPPTKAEKESAYVPAQPLQQDRAEAPLDPVALEFFKSIKSMTITGYYSSEVGMREELGDDGTVFFDGYAGCR
jgi:hypothetical protein